MSLRGAYRLVALFFRSLDRAVAEQEPGSQRDYDEREVLLRAEELEVTTTLTPNQCVIVAGREHNLSTAEIGRIIGRSNTTVRHYESKMRQKHIENKTDETNEAIATLTE